jgi:hypothetical protein
VVTELLGLEVDEEVVIPWIIRSDVKKMFIREVGIDGGTGSIGGEGCDKFARTRYFLLLGVENSRSYS